MGVVTSLSEFPKHLDDSVVTIGYFDGLHLGHQKLLESLLNKAKNNNYSSIVITFQNHPSELFAPTKPKHSLMRREQVYKEILEMGVDHVIALPFDNHFANQTSEQFIDSLLTNLRMKSLILGHDARIGKNREGTEEKVKQFATQKDFQVEYLSALLIEGEVVSSSRVKQALQSGDFSLTETLLGHPYSLTRDVIPGRGIGKSEMGFPTANMDVSNTILPPEGVYSVRLTVDGKSYASVANLGRAPTVRGDKAPLLEVHVIGKDLELTGCEVQITFNLFIRAEKKFSGLPSLRSQIEQDIQVAKSQL